jgi:multiple sugar transport system permease protein
LRLRITASSTIRGVGLLVIVSFALFPVYWMITTATHPQTEIYSHNPPLLPGLDHFGSLFSGSGTSVPILNWIRNSALVAAGTSLLSIVLATPAAYALSRYQFRGKALFGFGFFATQMLPEALLVVPLFAIFIRVGLVNSLWGLILADVAFAMPIAVWIIKAAIDAVPKELEEAARVDGCKAPMIVSQVTMPLILPSLSAAAVICFFSGWNEFLFAATFINDQSLWPASKGLASFIGEFATPIDTVMAAGVLFAIPAVVFFIFAQRGIVSGLTSGAVKG